MAGPGTHLHRIIKWWFNEDIGTGCKCELWIRKMDRNPVWAQNHVRLIAHKLRKVAIDRGWNLAVRIPGHRFPLRGMVVIAIQRSKWDTAREARRQSQHAHGRPA